MAIFQRNKGSSWHWPLLISVFLLNVCLPSLVLSYGTLLVHSVELGTPIQLGLATPVLFVLTFCLSQCWFREAADSWGGSLGYRAMAAVGLMMVAVGLLICSFIPYHLHIYFYGISGGLGTSLISAQADAVVFETYDSRLGTIRAICFSGQAIGLTIFPHVISALMNYYGYSLAHMMLAGVILQCMPIILLLKVDDKVTRPVSFSRYGDAAKTYAMVDDQTKSNYLTTDMQLHDLSKKCWKSPSDDNIHREHNNINYTDVYNNQEFEATITPPPSPEEKRRNIFGVELLPDIPEESEDSDTESNDNENPKIQRKRFSFAIKELSTLGDNIGECISNQIRRDSLNIDNNNYQEIEVYHENITPVTEAQREIIFNSFSFRYQSAIASLRRKFWIPSYRVYSLRRRLQFALYSINDTFVKPLTQSLSSWKFYPSLFLSFSKLCSGAIMMVMLPVIASEMRPKISMLETNFMISLYAFTWLSFLLSTPWLGQTVKRNFIYVTTAGLVVSTVSCFVITFSTNHDMFSIGCVIGGFGYGSVISCSDTAIQDFVGSRKWPKIHSTLETLSGILLAVFVIGIMFLIEEPHGLQYSLFILGLVLSATSIIWLVLSVISIYNTKIKYARIGRR